MMAVIENVNGYIQNMAPYVAALAGLPVDTVLGAAPSNTDLKSFGDRVVAVENNKLDKAGRTDPSPIPSGQIGELLEATPAGALSSGVIINAASIALPIGWWYVSGNVTIGGNGASAIGAVTTVTTLVSATDDVAYRSSDGSTQNLSRAVVIAPRYVYSDGTKTVYLGVSMNTFTGGPPQVTTGHFSARRYA